VVVMKKNSVTADHANACSPRAPRRMQWLSFARTTPRALLLTGAIASAVPLDARAQATQTPAWAPAVDSMIRAEMARSHIPGAQIAIAQGGRVVYTRGYGVADVESKRPVTERTLFQVGSIAKMITGAMLAQLGSEGILDLRAPISRYVPELSGRRVGSATLHQLLTNTAGWAEYANPFGSTDEGAPARIFPTLADTLILTEPDRVYSYSNLGFSVAGYVGERVMKTPFADLSERVVLRKMGMPRATFRSLVAMTRDFALGHMIDSTGAERHRVSRRLPVDERGGARAPRSRIDTGRHARWRARARRRRCARGDDGLHPRPNGAADVVGLWDAHRYHRRPSLLAKGGVGARIHNGARHVA
jgi:CubicO group peptidase (beta-lactamase class C family)